MSRLLVDGLVKGYGQRPVLRGRRSRGAGRLAHRGARALRLRQDDAAARDRRLRARPARPRRARRAHARRRSHLRAARAARHRLRPPGGRAVPAHDVEATSASGSPAPGAPRRRASRSCSRWSASPGSQAAARTSSPAASSSASRWRARWPAGRAALLLDEPFSSLDATLRNHVREEVHALLRAQGATTVLVTHDQEEALSLADIVAVLRDGRIVQQGAPAELYEQPADEHLARFLGAVNVIPAEFAPARPARRWARSPLRGEHPPRRAQRRGRGAPRAARGPRTRRERRRRRAARPRRAVPLLRPRRAARDTGRDARSRRAAARPRPRRARAARRAPR